jgi:mono/diheme cytochrome c family protein
MRNLRLAVGTAVLALGSMGCGAAKTTPSSTTGGSGGTTAKKCDVTATTGTVARGKYLVDHVLACGVCHTPNGPDGKPDMTKYLAGSRSYDFVDKTGTPITVNAENLTTHNPEGLATWCDEQIRTAIVQGVDDEHISIYPIMPYPEYALLNRSDVDSIIQYLRTVPPNDNVVAADYPYSDQDAPAPPLDATKVPHTTLASSDADFAAAERGRYIAATACLSCHTPQISDDVPDLTKAFGGGKTYTFIRGASPQTSTNLTPDATGLAGWSVDDIVAALTSTTEKGPGRAFCNTHPGGPDAIGGMTDGDLRDVAVYLHTLPPVKNGPFTCLP